MLNLIALQLFVASQYDPMLPPAECIDWLAEQGLYEPMPRNWNRHARW